MGGGIDRGCLGFIGRGGKVNTSSKAGQIAMCYDASRHATIQGMVKFIAGLNAERSALVSKWRENGGNDSDWLAIEELDKVIDSQESVLMSLEGGGK